MCALMHLRSPALPKQPLELKMVATSRSYFPRHLASWAYSTWALHKLSLGSTSDPNPLSSEHRWRGRSQQVTELG